MGTAGRRGVLFKRHRVGSAVDKAGSLAPPVTARVPAFRVPGDMAKTGDVPLKSHSRRGGWGGRPLLARSWSKVSGRLNLARAPGHNWCRPGACPPLVRSSRSRVPLGSAGLEPNLAFDRAASYSRPGTVTMMPTLPSPLPPSLGKKTTERESDWIGNVGYGRAADADRGASPRADAWAKRTGTGVKRRKTGK